LLERVVSRSCVRMSAQRASLASSRSSSFVKSFSRRSFSKASTSSKIATRSILS